MNVAAEPMSHAKIAKFAFEIRKILGLEKVPYFPIVQFLEWYIMDPDNGIDFEIVEPEEMEDTYGTTNTGRNLMRIRSDVYERAVQGNPRDRFTLCHEVGHFFLHRPECISYARGKVPIYQDPEWQANTFAAELMAPRQIIYNMSIETIMEECGMSRQAAMIQYDRI